MTFNQFHSGRLLAAVLRPHAAKLVFVKEEKEEDDNVFVENAWNSISLKCLQR